MSLVTNLDNIFAKDDVGKVRKAQEDSHDIALKTLNGDVFVVCDGMGGHVGGEKASSLAVENIIDHLKDEKYDDPLAALDGALKRANDQIIGFAQANPEYKGMGTTACVLLLQSDSAYIAHVGDSRIYIYLGEEKQLHRITKDHSYVQTLVDAGTITDEQAEHHPNKNRILKALGVTSNLQPSFGKVVPKNGDIFLICSDGLSGMIPDRTIERVLGHNTSLEERGESLINLAMEGETVHPGGQDNCTLELIKIDNSPWKKSEFTSYNPSHKTKNILEVANNGSKRKYITIGIIVLALLLMAAFLWKPIYKVYVNYRVNHYKQQEQISAKDTLESYKILSKKQATYDKKDEKGKKDMEIDLNNKKEEHSTIIKEYNDIKGKLDDYLEKQSKLR
jgi:serine/threonine protein phosphatase PrpC